MIKHFLYSIHIRLFLESESFFDLVNIHLQSLLELSLFLFIAFFHLFLFLLLISYLCIFNTVLLGFLVVRYGGFLQIKGFYVLFNKLLFLLHHTFYERFIIHYLGDIDLTIYELLYHFDVIFGLAEPRVLG
jgi:hypothetical protein